MSGECRDAVSLGAQMGGLDSDAATNEPVHALRKLLRRACPGPYSDVLKEIALILRIDGQLDRWHKSGVEGVALRKKYGYATADIYIPREAWSGVDERDFRMFLAGEVRKAVAEIADRARRQKLDFRGDQLKIDVETAIEEYLR